MFLEKPRINWLLSMWHNISFELRHKKKLMCVSNLHNLIELLLETSTTTSKTNNVTEWSEETFSLALTYTRSKKGFDVITLLGPWNLVLIGSNLYHPTKMSQLWIIDIKRRTRKLVNNWIRAYHYYNIKM